MAERHDTQSSLTFHRAYEMLYKDKELSVAQRYLGDVGCVVWDAAIVLARFLENDRFPEKFWRGKSVVELGAGTGFVGLVAACLGADVIVTDLEELVPLMRDNIERNKQLIEGRAEGVTLKWGDPSELKIPEVVLMSDLVYYPEALEPLCQTLTQLTDPQSLVLLCYEERDTGNKKELEERFFTLIKKRFEVSEVEFVKLDERYRSRDIHILTLKCA